MNSFDVYVFFLCFIVFTLLTVLLGGMLAAIIKLMVRLIRAGMEDEKIKTEYLVAKSKKRKCGCFDCIVSFILSIVLLSFFGFSLFVNLSQDTYFEKIPTLRVVNSASMAKKHPNNTYLTENALNDQFETFDLIYTYKLPAESELKLYDIVVYEVDEVLVVHRIVGIEEPNAAHPGERYFLCQGDAVERADRFPVHYSQMRAIYRGERIPFVGSFVTFMQSPAGWLCVLLIVAALIGTPILEKKINKEKMRRLIEIGFLNSDGSLYTPSPFAHLAGRKNTRTFEEALLAADEAMRARHAEITELLSRFDGIRVIEGKTRRTYKCGNTPVARLRFRGKTLYAFLSLTPADYAGTKYIFDDYGESREYRLYPMRMRQSSSRQARWTCELLLALAAKNGITVQEKPHEIVAEIEEISSPFAHLAGKKNHKTFRQRLLEAGAVVQERHDRIEALLRRFTGVRVILAAKQETYKCGSVPVARMQVRGKTLNAYIGLPCAEFENTKYIFEDVSGRQKFLRYPMRVRITSERQVRYACELLLALAARHGITVTEAAPVTQDESVAIEAENSSPFAHLAGRTDDRTFAERLDAVPPVVRERYESIVARLRLEVGMRVAQGKKQQTFLLGRLPVARLVIKGKTLNVYLALDPLRFESSKYVYTNASSVKRYARYPMRVRITSERQRRWTLELIDTLLADCEKARMGGVV